MTARALLLAVALAGTAVAQDVAPTASPALVAPVISWISVNGRPGKRAQLGGVVHLVGQGFPAPDAEGRPPPGLVVEVDDQPVDAFDCSTEYLGIRVPYDASALGLVRIRVTRADGARAETELALFDQGPPAASRTGSSSPASS